MAIRSGFFMSVNDDRPYKTDFFAEYFASFIGNGIFPNPSTNFQAIADNDNLTVTLKPGKSWINGYYAVNDNDYTLELDRADGVLNRIDRIVLRLDYLQRKIEPVVKKGNFASSPVAPSLQRDADFYELGLADVYIARGATTITQANVTDLRMNSTYCGIVAGVVQQIDVSSVFNQYQDWFNSYSVTKAQEFADWQDQTQQALSDWINNEQTDFLTWRQTQESIFADWYDVQKQEFDSWNDDRKAEFMDWFEDVQWNLSQEQAGNLYNLIDEHKEDIMPHYRFEYKSEITYIDELIQQVDYKKDGLLSKRETITYDDGLIVSINIKLFASDEVEVMEEFTDVITYENGKITDVERVSV